METIAAESCATEAQCVARYASNLACLYRRDPDLAAQLDAKPFSSLPKLETARNGDLTVRVPADDGRFIYLHSRYRPCDEARTFVDGLDEPDNAVFFVFGIGLGYHLKEFERRFDKPLLIVGEDDLGLLKAALCCVDLTELIRDGRLILVTSSDKVAVHERLGTCNADVMLGMQLVTPPQSGRYHASFHRELRAQITEFVTYSRMQIVTLLHNSRITCKNVAYNLPAYLGSPGIDWLKNRARGYPAILVAAGPSLARNIDQLRELRSHAVVIAAQTVLKTLLARDCPPHFVTSLDFHEISTQFFRGISELPETVLVAEPKATWPVVDMYPGRKHLLHNTFVDGLLRDEAPRRDGLRAGATVAHLSFYLAEYLGCDPIILVGQDLCYSEGLYYPPGMPIEEIWRPELSRFYSVETKQWERIRRAREILRVVTDIHGRDAYTDEQLYNYAEQFQRDFERSAATVIHAVEGGMRLAGVRVMSLRDAAQRACVRPLPSGLFDAGAAPPVPPPELKDRAIAALEQRLEELGAIREIGREMSGLLDKLVRLLDRPAEFNQLIVRVDELRLLIQNYARTYQLVLEVSQMAELRRHSADRRFGQVERETTETARRRLRRDREYVTSFLDGCEYLRDMLPPVIERIRESA